MRLSIAICTYNRCASLAHTLQSLVQSRIADQLQWEILLVDNNSTDDTRHVATDFSDRLPIRYLFEEKQGLSHARNRALVECRGDLIVFTDDDILVDEGWLMAYAEGYKRHYEAGYFGGPIHPYWPAGRPGWIKDERMPLISGLLGYYDLGNERRPYADDDMHPFGANFALSRSLFERLDPFRGDLGVSGSTPGRSEEAEYFRRAKASGGVGVYLPDALCLHTIQKSHLELKYLYRYGVQKGLAENRMTGCSGTAGPTFLPQTLLAVKGLMQLVRGHGDRARQCLINMGIQKGINSPF